MIPSHTSVSRILHSELALTHLRLLVLHHFLYYLVCICGETVDFNPPFVLETDVPKFLSIYNGYIYILWLKLMVIDWTEKLYMITISNQVEKFLPVQWGVSVAYMEGG